MLYSKAIAIIAITSGFAATAVAQLPNESATSFVNFVRSHEPLVPLTDTAQTALRPVGEVRTTTAYLDGLGRPLQTVAKQMTPAQKDMVTPIVYDGLGREAVKYLPFAATGGDGGYKADAMVQQAAFMQQQFGPPLVGGESHFYSETVLEESPLSRPLKTFAPGSSWAGSKGSATERAVQVQYKLNTTADSVRIWTNGHLPSTTGIYTDGSLAKTVTVDEHGQQVVEYKDNAGLVVLKKVQLLPTATTGHHGWLCTYYIYDDFNRLTMVLPPKATEAMGANGWQLTTALVNGLCFAYTYDARGRMVAKQVPGAAPVQMVYDARDRLVMVQDGNRATAGQWLVTQYDALNRPVRTYLWTNTATAAHHRQQAYNSNEYPASAQLAGANLLTETYHDHYDWVATSGTSLTATLDAAHTGNGNYFVTACNTAPLYAQPIVASYAVKGMVTGSRTQILGTQQYLYSVVFYDERGRAIQTQGTNASGGKDLATTQYDFSGKPLRQLVQHQKGTTAVTVLTKMAYDHAGRLLHIKKTVSGTINGATVSSPEKTVAQLTYNEMGQVAQKELGIGNGGSGPLESLRYDYNIRGWLLGINRDYVKDANSANWFGFELGYDRPGNIIPGQAYTNPQYNGNISGTTWKARGDAEKRKYDFAYDAANRLTGADFNQYSNNAFNKTAGLDFSVSNLAYDANGNILSMAQKGFKVGGLPNGGAGSMFIDQLRYGYESAGNKLIGVFDTANVPPAVATPGGGLGDFKYDPATKTATDYGYDANGNMVMDNNKKIGNIVYNHLNLPQTVTVAGQGVIEYVYDAAGNKLKKTVHETGRPNKTTEYISGFVYEDGQLQLLPHEEGRIRLAKQYYLSGDSAMTWQYDYFLKDHLGNVRTVLTEQRDTARYTASFELAQRAKETALFTNIAATAYPIASVASPAYPEDGTTEPNKYTSKLNGANKQLGATLALKVMAGDRVDIGVKAWVPFAASAPDIKGLEPQALLQGLIEALTNGASQLSGKASVAQLQGTGSPMLAGINSFLNGHNDMVYPSPPRAYLNWILFDEQFKYVPSGSGFIRVGYYEDGRLQQLVQNGLAIGKSGFLFVYLSNETSGKNVFFDNLTIQHYTGPLVEETQYYPFGLAMAGISSRAVGKMENKKKFNGYEENKTFDLNWLESFYRTYDPQLGRFWQVDPKANEFESLYAGMGNNPVLKADPLGDTVHLTGKYVDKLLGLINEGLNGFYTASVNNNGILSITATNKKGEQGQAKGFYEVLSGIISDKRGVVNIGTVSGSNKVDVDSWVQQKIDVKDVEKFGNGKYRSIASVIAHAFAEQQSLQLDNKGDRDRSIGAYYRDHEKGLMAEQQVTGYLPTNEIGGLRNNIFGNTKGTIVQVFAKPTGRFNERNEPVYTFNYSSMTFKNGNLVSYVEDVPRPK